MVAEPLSVNYKNPAALLSTLLAGLLVFQTARSAQADQTFHLKPDRKYTVRIIDFLKDGHSAQRMLILKGKTTVIDQTFHGFAVVDPFHGEPNLGIEGNEQPPIFDLNGDGVPDLIIRRWTGGAHGTYYYDFYTLTDPLKKLWSFYAGDGHLLLSKNSDRRHRLPVLYIEDATFRYWETNIFKCPSFQSNGTDTDSLLIGH